MAESKDEKRRGRSARAAALQARVDDVPPATEPGDEMLGLGGPMGVEPGPDELGLGGGSPVEALDGAVAALEGLQVPPELQGDLQGIVSQINMLKEKLAGGGTPEMNPAGPMAPPGALQGVMDLSAMPMV